MSPTAMTRPSSKTLVSNITIYSLMTAPCPTRPQRRNFWIFVMRTRVCWRCTAWRGSGGLAPSSAFGSCCIWVGRPVSRLPGAAWCVQDASLGCSSTISNDGNTSSNMLMARCQTQMMCTCPRLPSRPASKKARVPSPRPAVERRALRWPAMSLRECDVKQTRDWQWWRPQNWAWASLCPPGEVTIRLLQGGGVTIRLCR
mmetsp:Transcript_40043/g.58940  ORF Transcript_40043/g.58940 Transcript_40043/m.58940 type:complete len:200 (+) Transcript_40043:1531-2130(+)